MDTIVIERRLGFVNGFEVNGYEVRLKGHREKWDYGITEETAIRQFLLSAPSRNLSANIAHYNIERI